MWKAILTGTTALTLIGASLAHAQQTAPAQTSRETAQPRPQLTAEQVVARTNVRIAELKTELKLTPAQEKNWAAFETALRDSAKERAAHFEQVRKMRETSGAGQARGERPAATAEEIAAQKKLATALEPLYKSLDDGQKQRFTAMFRTDGEGRRFWFRGRGDQRGDQRS